jgi:hypothetical protein
MHNTLLLTYTDSYLAYFDTLVPRFYTLIQPTRSISDRQWALCVFDDVIYQEKRERNFSRTNSKNVCCR